MAPEKTTLKNPESASRGVVPAEQPAKPEAPESRAAKMIREVFESGRPLT